MTVLVRAPWTARGLAAAFAATLAVSAAGCRSEGQPGTAGSSSDVTPAQAPAGVQRTAPPFVSLPDLSTISGSAREQLREAYAALEALRQRAGASDDEIGAAYGELGKLLMAAKYRDAAAASFLNAEARSPADARWPYYLGHVHQAAGEPDEAAAAFARALRLRPDDVPALVWLGRMEFDRGRPAEAARHFERALVLQPGSAAALLGLGQVALARQEYARAVDYLERGLAIESGAGTIRYALGMAYRGLGDSGRAESHLRRRNADPVALRDPLMEEIDALLETAIAYEIRGGQALDRGDWAAAADHFRQAIELAPGDPSPRHKLATALAMGGDARAALQQMETLVRRWPAFAPGQFSLGVMFASSGRHREAADHFAAAARSDPSHVQARLQLAGSLRASGRFEAAIASYREAVELDPRVAPAYFGQAMALVQLRRFREAADLLARASRTFPGEAGFAHAMARLLAAAPDDAVRDGRHALELVEGLIGGRRASLPQAETMAMALAEVGRYGEAAKWQREAIAGARQAGLADLLPRMEDNLRRYERGEPCRTPWGAEIAYATL